MTLTGKEAIERIQRQQERQNKHIKENYDRISVTLPKGTKEQIKTLGMTANGYINQLVNADLEKRNKSK